ncbi:MAG: PRC-barrel domain-containing protein [Candidatus Aenigmarchaeota archaeon]|nr:PRC-barrel domain-containing protein [Candidatus Aenigmarchaeota archaeon]OYT57919.1 MAG: hypothetical protein B6U68_01085 [Candidatus Aenigmarchaeota archaeon ex4484_14]RLB75216.1 MAG: hypothetical protein DRH15_14425 [Deltaproteobacteria bacterium]
MAITVKDFSEMIDKDVFTTKGVYCGRTSDVYIDLDKFRISSLVVDAVRDSFLEDLVGNKKGVVIPFSMIESIGDIVIMKHISPMSIPKEQPSEPE